MAGIAFITLLSFDGYVGDLSLSELVAHALVHLSFSIILTILLTIAWKWEKTGGILLLAIGLFFAPFVYALNHGRNHFSTGQSLIVVLVVNAPFILAGTLFLICHRKKKEARAGNSLPMG